MRLRVYSLGYDAGDLTNILVEDREIGRSTGSSCLETSTSYTMMKEETSQLYTIKLVDNFIGKEM